MTCQAQLELGNSKSVVKKEGTACQASFIGECSLVWRCFWRWLKMPLNKSRVQEGWVVFEPVCSSPNIWECKVLWLLSASVLLVWALPLQIRCEGAFLLPMLCTQIPSSFFNPCVCLSVVASSLPSHLSCKHTLHSPNVNTQGVSAYLFSLAGEAAPFSEVGEHRETPPCIPYLVLSSSPLTSVCEAPIFWPQCLRRWGSSALPFPLVCSCVL